eukprot:2837362-Prymnesium_polylepis.1
MHVVLKLKRALKTTDVESAIRAGNRLEAVIGSLETLLREVHGEERVELERGERLARKLKDNSAIACKFYDVMRARLLP